MAEICFTKMNGAGNDFVMLDNRSGSITLDGAAIAGICDRHRGVGADGLILLENGDEAGTFRMRYHNSDGGEAEMCGNGARCFARFAQSLSPLPSPFVFQTGAGPISAEFLDGTRVRLGMGRPKDFVRGRRLAVHDREFTVWSINTGVPHAVVAVADVEKIDIRLMGRALREHAEFAPRGTNVNFVQSQGSGRGIIRTYERGVEDETLACGTGVVATALVLAAMENLAGPVSLFVRGGEWLEVSFKGAPGSWNEVTLCGPADVTFEGRITI